MNAFVTKSTGTKTNEDERLPKRRRINVAEKSASGKSEESSSENEDSTRTGIVAGHKDLDEVIETRKTYRVTELENVLPPTQTDEVAIEEYELAKSSQASAHQDREKGGSKTSWVPGRSSIYVDAFNVALDTVLEEESLLFDERELAVFRHWKELSYEAQFLYVRLFLRKTAAWHRVSRLGYHSDISDPLAAIESLQESRRLPPAVADDAEDMLPGFAIEGNGLEETFAFADASEDHITTVDEAASLLYLDELKALAKETKVQGRNKAELVRNICRTSHQQAGLAAVGLSRHNSRDSDAPLDTFSCKAQGTSRLGREDSSREHEVLDKMLAIVGPCIRLSPATAKLFERVHLVFYRSTEWTEKSLTTMILAKIARRKFPEYIVCRTSNIFASRLHLLEFEAAVRLEAEVDGILEANGTPTEADFERIMDIFERVHPRWRNILREEHDKERKVYEMGEGAYLRRFSPGHAYTRIIHKALYVLGRRKEHGREHGFLLELLEQKLFHLARRGAWYQRKALLEEHYMAKLEGEGDSERLRREWLRRAATTCETGLQDADCHLIHHYDLQKRLVKLEKKLRIPRRLQHDFGHVGLAKPTEMTIEGVQLKR